MGRPRASGPHGYVKKTISLPAEVFVKIGRHLEKNPRMTLSSFVTTACESYLEKD